ncbi:hypothetical protein L596_011354 [Steinernema carpocapsae]|uniref:Uncharacterized protein n=1 Tax=Steinernema carpocapsae TaxID=34508 RepID=A0A4V6A4G4_STECR|nr:hypothetical protein L596_011354 [Steinernema carpocapsae]
MKTRVDVCSSSSVEDARNLLAQLYKPFTINGTRTSLILGNIHTIWNALDSPIPTLISNEDAEIARSDLMLGLRLMGKEKNSRAIMADVQKLLEHGYPAETVLLCKWLDAAFKPQAPHKRFVDLPYRYLFLLARELAKSPRLFERPTTQFDENKGDHLASHDHFLKVLPKIMDWDDDWKKRMWTPYGDLKMALSLIAKVYAECKLKRGEARRLHWKSLGVYRQEFANIVSDWERSAGTSFLRAGEVWFVSDSWSNVPVHYAKVKDIHRGTPRIDLVVCNFDSSNNNLLG